MTSEDIERLGPAMDRFREAHFWLHGLEEYYHFAEPFRWHLNAFLKALKEIPELVSFGLQNRDGFPDFFRPLKESLNQDILIRKLSKQRDFVVHQGQLVPGSRAAVGITEGRGLKLGFGGQFPPLLDSDEAMKRFVEGTKKSGDFLGILAEDEESYPCVERTWVLPELGDREVLDICSEAWLKVGTMLTAVMNHLGEPSFVPDLNCRHDPDTVKIRAYDRDELRSGVIRGFRI
jgi:hypothetical protein